MKKWILTLQSFEINLKYLPERLTINSYEEVDSDSAKLRDQFEVSTWTLNYQFVWRSGFWLCKASRSIWSIYLVPTTLLIFVLVKHSISGSNGSSPMQYFTYFVQRVKGSVQQRPYHWQPHIVPCNFRKCWKWKRRRCRKKYFRCWMDVKKKNKELSYPSLFSKDEENDLTVIS